MIHYCKSSSLRTACGIHARDLEEEACLTTDLDTTDCELCLASDEVAAQRMEQALTLPVDPAQFIPTTQTTTEPGIFLPQEGFIPRVVPRRG